MSKVPILTYHSIDSSGSVISTSPEKFVSQMRYLAESFFKVISLNDVVKCIQERRPFPPKSAVITFDDGFKNIYDEAYPVLKKFGFKATVFLVPRYCGRNNRWNGQPEGIPTLDLLGWDEIGEMVHNGVEFGAHTMSHPNLSMFPCTGDPGNSSFKVNDSKAYWKGCLIFCLSIRQAYRRY